MANGKTTKNILKSKIKSVSLKFSTQLNDCLSWTDNKKTKTYFIFYFAANTPLIMKYFSKHRHIHGRTNGCIFCTSADESEKWKKYAKLTLTGNRSVMTTKRENPVHSTFKLWDAGSERLLRLMQARDLIQVNAFLLSEAIDAFEMCW